MGAVVAAEIDMGLIPGPEDAMLAEAEVV